MAEILREHSDSLVMAKIKAYASVEERDFQEDEIAYFDKRELYRFVQKAYKDLCADLNQITQMILSLWFQKIGLCVPHNDVANILLQPGRWLYHKNPSPVGQEENAISRFRVCLFEAIEHLGAGVYFFPSFQQRWSVFQEALAAHSGSAADFIHKHHDNKIAPIFIKLFSIVHPDRAFPFKSDWTSESVNDLAKSYIPRIQSIKHDLQKFKEQDSIELQSSDAEIEAELLLKWLKDAVLNYMQYHLRSEGWVVSALTLSPNELQQQYSQEICEYVSEVKQIDANIAKARRGEKEERKEKEAVQAEIENERKEKEAIQAENERLKALLAKLQPAVAEEPLVQPQPTIAGSRGALFHVPTTSKASTAATENPILLEHSYAP
ncbi:hypothetical protein [Rickettsiella endosymbiont of Dermanyssus gallinae]|uniref:hypothetical protein n=1 Tax=Rickettsiella endosymbiont of Dermanyssus gallinae TaxID=2856608 RepID=UPI001C528863|nr:hypothetical protein [Rickettsiella endosymbiont of Dermanyssus gallinae]